jgi:hypothetical protein
VSPALRTIPPSIAGTIGPAGAAVSRCAQKTSGIPGAVAGSRARRLPGAPDELLVLGRARQRREGDEALDDAHPNRAARWAM